MVANVLLGHERGSGATVTPIVFRAELDRLVEICKARGLTDDPAVRQGLADFHTQVELLRFAGMRALSRYLAGQAPGPESSLFKLAWSEYHRRVSEAAVNWLGADAIAGFGDSTADGLGASGIGVKNDVGAWLYAFYIARSGTIYAGTSQVQRNIIGERVLGLPREPRADAGPWNETTR
ncbi:MAG: acyl-CoA dehydrogenase family protein [Acidimicrobiales bacterium]